MTKISDFMTVGEAAEYLSVSKDSLRRWDRAGKLKARRHPINGYRLYRKGDLDALLRRFGCDGASSGRSASAKNKKAKRKR